MTALAMVLRITIKQLPKHTVSRGLYPSSVTTQHKKKPLSDSRYELVQMKAQKTLSPLTLFFNYCKGKLSPNA